LSSEPPPDDRFDEYADVVIAEDEVKSAARSCFVIVLILGALLVVAAIFAIVALVA
jgi:hypothetical protein